MKLFDEMFRNDEKPALYAQPDFDFLNRSARPECQGIRELLEQWFEHVPPDGQSDLRSRFRDKDNRHHVGAFLELYLHELLLQLKFDIEPHPPMNNESTHPDFLVAKDGNRLFYLEATLAAPSDAEVAANARKNQLYDTLNRMESADFFIGIRIGDLPEIPPPGRTIRRYLERKLADLDPDEVAQRFKEEGFGGLPLWKWEHEDWQIQFYPIPKSASARGKLGVRPIGMETREPSVLIPHVRIRESIKEKASKYGQLDLPYMIALNVIDEFDVDDIDIDNALFGEEYVTLVLLKNGSHKQIPRRKANGAWLGPNGPQNRRVGGILMATNLHPWNMARASPVLWQNPWAHLEVPRDVWPLSQMILDPENGQLEERQGLDSGRLLGLGPGWPYDDDPR